MLKQIFSSVGGLVGKSIGPGWSGLFGQLFGKLGQYFEEYNYDTEYYSRSELLKDSIPSLTYGEGRPIPLIYGSARMRGHIIWAERVRFNSLHSTNTKYFSFSGLERSITDNTTYEYFLTFAVAISQGEISAVNRVWDNDKLINLSHYKYRIYLGSEAQTPDPVIVAREGVKNTPAFRGLAYIIFEDLPLADFGNRIPNLSFEVTRKVQLHLGQTLEQKISAFNIIPGSGEFVYDTEIVYKEFYIPESNVLVTRQAINAHGSATQADAVYNMNQLTQTCPNLKWVSVVVCWFGDSLDISECNILPRVEFNDEASRTSEIWQVGSYGRSNTPLISKDQYGNPNYGGTVNDASLVRYIDFLRSKGLKIMLSPMFFMDLPGKPWRGMLTGSAQYVTNFFNKPSGYRNFILHYAHLLKGKVDAFLIGSELVGLTQICEKNAFPAVEQFILLASEIKSILGPETKISYAANWDEYHHTHGGWYNLDPLWAHKAIDYIGISAYFPLTNIKEGEISSKDIQHGWKSGEGYDYYYDASGNKQPVDAPYAWKNIEYWWNNQHVNPDGRPTPWQPKSKKIWFTEFGFPSVDKAPNQPNVFFDPHCINGGLPKYSNGNIDFAIQRLAITETLSLWQNAEFVSALFLWCWDARPYPAWPHGKIWTDGHLWQMGHWLNGKLADCSLAAIIFDLAIRAGIAPECVDVSQIDIPVHGASYQTNSSFSEAIELLSYCYNLDAISAQAKLLFLPKSYNARWGKFVSHKDYIAFDSACYIKQQFAVNEITGKITLSYNNYHDDYQAGFCQASDDHNTNVKVSTLNLPLALAIYEAEYIARNIFMALQTKRQDIVLQLPLYYLYLKPSHIINCRLDERNVTLRIIDLKISSETILVHARICYETQASLYNNSYAVEPKNADYSYEPLGIRILQLPYLAEHTGYISLAYDYLPGYEVVMASFGSYPGEKVASFSTPSIIAKVTAYAHNPQANPYLIDYRSKITVFSRCEIREPTESEFLTGKTRALLGSEIIRYRHVSKQASNLYVLSGLIRGEMSSEDYIGTAIPGSELIILSTTIPVYISPKLDSLDISFYAKENKNCTANTTFLASSQQLAKPFIEYCHITAEHILQLKWCNRNRYHDDFMTVYLPEYSHVVIEIRDAAEHSYQYNSRENNLDIELRELDLTAPFTITLMGVNEHGTRSVPKVMKMTSL